MLRRTLLLAIFLLFPLVNIVAQGTSQKSTKVQEVKDTIEAINKTIAALNITVAVN